MKALNVLSLSLQLIDFSIQFDLVLLSHIYGIFDIRKSCGWEHLCPRQIAKYSEPNFPPFSAGGHPHRQSFDTQQCPSETDTMVAVPQTQHRRIKVTY